MIESAMPPADIIVIGGSVGALDILLRIVRAFPENLPASVMVVLHLSPDAESHVAEIVGRESRLPAVFAQNGERLTTSTIYIAPPDRHMLVCDGIVQLTKGPRENRSRPAIDPLFRSAARSYGKRVIAVLLSGLFDDGVQGLQVISANRGTVIVLKPEDTPQSQMPENAIKYDSPEYVLEADQIFPTIQQLLADHMKEPETDAIVSIEDKKGPASGFICPDCGGALFEETHHELPHYTCRVGHSYSLNALLASYDDALETALWAAVRSLQESAELKQRTAMTLERKGPHSSGKRLREDAQTQMEQSRLLRERIIEAKKRR